MRIGIAGYTGSGKSTCAHILCNMGCEIINGDVEAKKLMQIDPEIKAALAERFGSEVVCDGEIRFEILSQKVFSSLDALTFLNSIVHPKLVAALKRQIEESQSQRVILDAALIPLWHIEQWFDLCLWIETPFELRLQRLKSKCPKMDEESILKRMNLQTKLFSAPQGPCWQRIDNSGDPKNLKECLIKIDFSGIDNNRKD